jgi:hypothetical protein
MKLEKEKSEILGLPQMEHPVDVEYIHFDNH